MYYQLKSGFTLIELLVVIAILSILSTLGVANFRTARIKALDAQRKADLQTIAKSLEAYVNDHRSYPTTDLPWGAALSSGTTVYATQIPTDPAGHAYAYVSSGGTSYTLYARLDNPNDPALVVTSVTCGGTNLCNYQLKSSNQP